VVLRSVEDAYGSWRVSGEAAPVGFYKLGANSATTGYRTGLGALGWLSELAKNKLGALREFSG
jgi:hypothetical protein